MGERSVGERLVVERSVGERSVGERSVVVLLVHAGENASEGLDPLAWNSAAGDREIEGALWLGRRVQAATRAVAGRFLQIGKCLDQVVDLDVRQPERPDA